MSLKQTKYGLVNYQETAFATPFALLMGTGGSPQVQPVTTSGNSLFVVAIKHPIENSIKNTTFINDLQRFMNEYALGKSQAAALLNITRPTIYSWLNNPPEKIRDAHQIRLSTILGVFDQQIDPSLRHFSGQFLQRKLDPSVRELLKACSNDNLPLDEIENILKRWDFKLSGIDRSKALSTALAAKKPLI